MGATLAAPLRVSPLIKTARWSFLLAGFMYGSSRNATLLVEEAAFREEEAKKQAIIDAQKAEEKKAANRTEMIYLATSKCESSRRILDRVFAHYEGASFVEIFLNKYIL